MTLGYVHHIVTWWYVHQNVTTELCLSHCNIYLWSSHCDVKLCTSHCGKGLCSTHIMTFGNVCHIATLGFCTSHCDKRFSSLEWNILRCLRHCDVSIRIYIIIWCYGWWHSDDESMCIALQCYKVHFNVTNKRVLWLKVFSMNVIL